jgi:hypothetical protein
VLLLLLLLLLLLVVLVLLQMIMLLLVLWVLLLPLLVAAAVCCHEVRSICWAVEVWAGFVAAWASCTEHLHKYNTHRQHPIARALFMYDA